MFMFLLLVQILPELKLSDKICILCQFSDVEQIFLLKIKGRWSFLSFYRGHVNL